jgi:hypothetical protein
VRRRLKRRLRPPGNSSNPRRHERAAAGQQSRNVPKQRRFPDRRRVQSSAVCTLKKRPTAHSGAGGQRARSPLSDLKVVCESEVQAARQPPSRRRSIRKSSSLAGLGGPSVGRVLLSSSGSSAARNPAAGPTRMRPIWCKDRPAAERALRPFFLGNRSCLARPFPAQDAQMGIQKQHGIRHHGIAWHGVHAIDRISCSPHAQITNTSFVDMRTGL